MSDLTVLNGGLYFDGNDGTDGQQLWTSDGIESGTVAVTDFGAGECLDDLQSVNGSLYFLARMAPRPPSSSGRATEPRPAQSC